MNENQTLYLTSWEYNAALILTELAKIVDNNGGEIKPLTPGFIVNRSILNNIQDKELRIEHANETKKEFSDNEKAVAALENAIKSYTAEIEELKTIKNDPVRVTHTTWITFILDGSYYYYQIEENPFFDFYFRKTPVINGRVSRDTLPIEDKKEWCFDCFFKCDCSKADIKEAANLIFNMLVNSGYSKISRDTHKIRVKNTYNNGYHYEQIVDNERFEDISWFYQVEK